MCRIGERAPEPTGRRLTRRGGGDGKQDKRVRHSCAHKCRSAHVFFRHDTLRARAAPIRKSTPRWGILRAVPAETRSIPLGCADG